MAMGDMSRINAQTRDRSQNIPDFHGISNKGDLMTFLPTSKTGDTTSRQLREVVLDKKQRLDALSWNPDREPVHGLP
jgi:hypothetical protein